MSSFVEQNHNRRAASSDSQSKNSLYRGRKAAASSVEIRVASGADNVGTKPIRPSPKFVQRQSENSKDGSAPESTSKDGESSLLDKIYSFAANLGLAAHSISGHVESMADLASKNPKLFLALMNVKYTGWDQLLPPCPCTKFSAG